MTAGEGGGAQAVESPTDRLRLILGDEGLRRLRDARVMVVGLGGVGSACAEALYDDPVAHFRAEVAREMALDINPDADVTACHMFVERDRLEEQLGALGPVDYVVDAIDTVGQKLRLAAWCQGQGLPEVSAMGGANKLDPCRLRFASIEETVNCPLARVMRKECRRRGIRGLQVLFSDEEPVRMERISDERWLEEGPLLGTMSYLPPIMGQMLASRVIRDLLGWEVA